MKRAIPLVVFPLSLGALFYLAFRSPDLRLHQWAAWLGIPHAHLRVPNAISGSFPDAAWAFALGAALALVWRNSEARARFAWLIAGALLAAALEVGQYFHVVPGVFDPIDLASMIGGYIAGAGIALANFSGGYFFPASSMCDASSCDVGTSGSKS